jgi:hypothetical protein
MWLYANAILSEIRCLLYLLKKMFGSLVINIQYGVISLTTSSIIDEPTKSLGIKTKYMPRAVVQ